MGGIDMELMEELFTMLWEEPPQLTEEYMANRKLRDKLSNQVENVIGPELMDKFMDAHWDYMEQECRRFLLNGVRLGLELLRL